MNSALALDRSPAARAPEAERSRAGRPLERREPLPAGADAAPSALAAGWKSPQRPRGFWLAVAGVHVLGAWALSQSLRAAPEPHKAEPVQVRLLTPPPPPVQIKQLVSPEPRLAPTPLTPVIAPPNVQVIAAAVVAEPAQPLQGPVAAATPAPVAKAAPVAAGPRQLAPDAVRYVAEPRLHMPRMSRRLGESGTVQLHIVVDVHGQLKTATVKKSSGYERLDEQALQDIRSARFAPYLEQGQPVEWEADAGLQYETTGR